MALRKSFTEPPFSITCTVIRFEDRYAVLKNPDTNLREFFWPLSKLPENISVGDQIVLKVTNEQIEKEAEYERMRKLLEELVN